MTGVTTVVKTDAMIAVTTAVTTAAMTAGMTAGTIAATVGMTTTATRTATGTSRSGGLQAFLGGSCQDGTHQPWICPATRVGSFTVATGPWSRCSASRMTRSQRPFSRA